MLVIYLIDVRKLLQSYVFLTYRSVGRSSLTPNLFNKETKFIHLDC